MALLSEMREAKLEPNVISYNAGISACDKSRQWQRALSLLSEMWEAKLGSNVISYYSRVGACEKGEWPWAMALVGAQLRHCQRWDQRAREGWVVAAGPGAAQRDVGGERGTRRDVF